MYLMLFLLLALVHGSIFRAAKKCMGGEFVEEKIHPKSFGVERNIIQNYCMQLVSCINFMRLSSGRSQAPGSLFFFVTL